MNPLVSIMMPAYNASCFISAAIESVQSQSYQNWQLCIVDDGSHDLTAEIAQTFANLDGRIIVDKIQHAGCPSARNHCLRIATGDIIARLDADDTHEPDRITKQVAFLLEEDVDIVTCGMAWLKGKLRMVKNVGAMDVCKYLDGTSNGPCCASLVTWARVYEEVGGFDEEMLAGSDGDWNFRAIVAGKTWGHIDQAWYNQRRHNKQLSQSMGIMQRQVHEASRKKYLKQWNSSATNN